MKMFGGAQKEAKSTAPPPRTQNAKAKFFEDMAAKQQAQAAAPSGPPVLPQRASNEGIRCKLSQSMNIVCKSKVDTVGIT